MNALFRYFNSSGSNGDTTRTQDAPIWFLGRSITCASPVHAGNGTATGDKASTSSSGNKGTHDTQTKADVTTTTTTTSAGAGSAGGPEEGSGDKVSASTSKGSTTSDTGSDGSHTCGEGCHCPRSERNAHFAREVKRLFWCTYRRDFPPLYTGSSTTTASSGDSSGSNHSSGGKSNASGSTGTHQRSWSQMLTGNGPGRDTPNLTSDAGWGCMIRSGQMLLANVLVRHTRDVFAHDPLHPDAISRDTILSWFLDRPHPESPYSIHHIVNTGRHLGKPVGDWFGPATISEVLVQLVNQHKPGGLIAVNCASDATVYANEVLQAATQGKGEEAEWQPLLLLVQVRLGLSKMNAVYREALLKTFTLPQCAGVIGGRPKAAAYFVAVHGEHVYYLDPHTIQHSLDVSECHADDETYHTPNPYLNMHVSEIDPSLALAFYIKGRSDFANFCVAVNEIESHGDAVFHVAQTRPDYTADDLDCDIVSLDDEDSDGDDLEDM
eukprot:TRINITY_DN2519_c0_g1_i5.p1 TRINITY_DN2519_c0_g1~~TRINITY_DN2519_c0_g1_i5.p1  ORF type:complete len:494 (+),score=85.19 TRINITY_DN2519_c0_g1_i5:345-1826(+)